MKRSAPSSCVRGLNPWCRLAIASSALWLATSPTKGAEFAAETHQFIATYCSECHGRELAEAHLSLAAMLEKPELATRFRVWEKVASAVEQAKMPPDGAARPSDAERKAFANDVRRRLRAVAEADQGDPGPVTLRRLTGAEYDYTLQDLTGLSLNLQPMLDSDAAGGEGFANIGDVQFFQESTLERYLEAAKRVAQHLIVGAGSLRFAEDPGATGQELAAISRIQAIYRQHGFRMAAGEGAEPFGLDLYPRAFFVAWQYRFRSHYHDSDILLSSLAEREKLPPAFAEQIWTTLQQSDASFPAQELIDAWKALPAPPSDRSPVEVEASIRAACEQIAQQMRGWQRRLARRSADGEEAAILTADSVDLASFARFRLNLKFPDGMQMARWKLHTRPAAQSPIDRATIVWKRATIRFRRSDGTRLEAVDLAPLLSPDCRAVLERSKERASQEPDTCWVARGEQDVTIELPLPPNVVGAMFQVDADLETDRSSPSIVRCSVVAESLGTTAADDGESSAILGIAEGPEFEAWKRGVQTFARSLPAISHREPTPSDRDPIPAPYDNAYNGVERNEFHYQIKYHRDDAFLTHYLLDDATREQLDQAWADLLLSFEYHNTYLSFIFRKFMQDSSNTTIASVDQNKLAALPPDVLPLVVALKQNYEQARARMQQAEAHHGKELEAWAARAWRRPLTDDERNKLRDFYQRARQQHSLDHAGAVRSTLVRILVASPFLFRLEPHERTDDSEPALTAYELASRLSYFLWASLPDDHLLEQAASGKILEDAVLRKETQRMLTDPKSQRFALEFFGQWFGFYRFNEFTGIDSSRFPELDRELKQDLYDEARTFFGHIVQADRPVDEILFADYAFWNDRLRQHYQVVGIEANEAASEVLHRVSLGPDAHRGGLLGLAAIHAVTSAPLRTSPVKRGDWILRRVLGTPVPPPPADAGSLPADDLVSDGASVRDRLVAHRQQATCVNCHARMDPLGFAMENYDPIGRWREHYRDGKRVENSGQLEDGTTIDGLAGLQQHLRSRQTDFERTLSVKLLGYALGRGERLTDQALVDQMVRGLSEDARFSTLVHQIVQSRQFRSRARRQE